MVGNNNFYRIKVELSGKVLNFAMVNDTYNKYQTGTGELLINEKYMPQIIKITASNDIIKQLQNKVGEYVVLAGCIRNYRQDDQKFNVLQVYSVSDCKSEEQVNQVNATGEVISISTIKDKENGVLKAVQLFLLTNEKYNKHARLRAVMFNNENHVIEKGIPEVNQIYMLNGYLQANKVAKQEREIDGENKLVRVGELELVFNEFSRIDDSEK